MSGAPTGALTLCPAVRSRRGVQCRRMRPHSALRLLVLTCAALVGLAGCASGIPSDPLPDGAEAAELVETPDPVAPPAVAEFWFTVYPTPRRVEYGERMLPLEGALWVDETSDAFDEWLRRFGLEVGWAELEYEGFAIGVAQVDGRTVVLNGARSDVARDWLDGALTQLTDASHAEGPRIRACRLLDQPALPLRGNKRPRAWEREYRANYAWGVGSGPAHDGRIQTAYYHPRHPLDVGPESVERILAYFEPALEQGVQQFALKFDDTGFGMTARTRLLFGGYPSAVRSLLTRVRMRLRERDPKATLYYLPQTYWWDDPRLAAFSRGIRVAGGLDADIGLVLTGPRIISETIDTEGLAAARGEFGLIRTKALIYDNLGREGDWGPLTGRDPDLWRQADAVFGERGTAVNRLTRLDWSWNPTGYDAERSWRRALFELAGPRGFLALRAVCQAYRDDAPRERVAALVDTFAATDLGGWDGPVDQQVLVDELRADLSRLEPEGGTTAAASPSAASWRTSWERRNRAGL